MWTYRHPAYGLCSISRYVTPTVAKIITASGTACVPTSTLERV